jgi:uncharacterized protein YdcH (DUF465 family)
MTYVQHHDLAHEFPEFKEQIHDLKTHDHKFAQLFDEYQKVDKEICRIEDGIEHHSDKEVDELKLERVALKDMLYARLKAAASA